MKQITIMSTHFLYFLDSFPWIFFLFTLPISFYFAFHDHGMMWHSSKLKFFLVVLAFSSFIVIDLCWHSCKKCSCMTVIYRLKKETLKLPVFYIHFIYYFDEVSAFYMYPKRFQRVAFFLSSSWTPLFGMHRMRPFPSNFYCFLSRIFHIFHFISFENKFPRKKHTKYHAEHESNHLKHYIVIYKWFLHGSCNLFCLFFNIPMLKHWISCRRKTSTLQSP